MNSKREIGAFAARTHLLHLLESVAHGESFAITKRGKVIAFLTPAEYKPVFDVADAIQGIKNLRKKIMRRKTKLTFKEFQRMKEEGRR